MGEVNNMIPHTLQKEYTPNQGFIMQSLINATVGLKHSQQVGEKSKKQNMGPLWSLGTAVNIFYWYTEDDLDGLIDPNTGSHSLVLSHS